MTTMDEHADAQRAFRIGLVVFTALYTTFFAGAFFGWGPMALMLEDDGAFEYQCSAEHNQNSTEPCDAQTLSLLNVQFVANLMPFLSPFLGSISDQYGSLVLVKILSLAGTLGVALIIVASLSGIDQLYYPAFSGMGICFVSTSVIIVQTGMVFPSETAQRRVISLLNGLLDAGSITYLILYQIYLAVDTTLVGIASGYLVFGLFCFAGAIYFWTILLPPKAKLALSDDTASLRDESADEITVDKPVDPVDGRSCSLGSNESPDAASDYVVVSQRKPMEQLKSQQFLLLVTFFVVHVARNNWTMTVARDYLASLGDDDVDNKYLSIFTGLSVASIAGLPFIDHLLEKYGYHVGFQTVNALAILHGIIQLSSNNLNVQVIGFVVYSFYRCFTFATSFSFLPVFLGGQTIGRGAGLLAFSGAVSNLFNLGLASWVVRRLEQNYFAVNLLYTLAILPIIAVTYQIGICIQREQKAAKVAGFPSNDEGNETIQPVKVSDVETEYEREYEC